METQDPTLAEPERAKPLTLDYISATLRPRRHGGPGNDWWALWAFALWSVLVAAFIWLALFLSRR